MKKYLLMIAILLIIGVKEVHAYQNTGAFNDLTISENGAFWNNTNSSGANTSIGYTLEYGNIMPNNDMQTWYAFTTNNITLGTYGMTLTQCGIPIQANRNYAMLYYFISANTNYIYPSYSSVSNKIGISNNNSSVTMNTYTNVWYADNNVTEIGPGYAGIMSFAITFTPQIIGNCVSVAISTRNQSISHNYNFVGYKLYDYGQTAITTTDIQNALSSNFTTINNNINGLNNSIDDVNDTLSQDHTYNNNASENIQGKDDIDDMTDAEEDLFDSIDMSGANQQVSIDANTSSFIWDIVNSLRGMSTYIVLLITSILGIGIIKLVLNR